ncbi:DUF1330 domain-containing protein [Rhizobium sp.]
MGRLTDDQEVWKQYFSMFPATIEQHPGLNLARGGEIDVIEGD